MEDKEKDFSQVLEKKDLKGFQKRFLRAISIYGIVIFLVGFAIIGIAILIAELLKIT